MRRARSTQIGMLRKMAALLQRRHARSTPAAVAAVGVVGEVAALWPSRPSPSEAWGYAPPLFLPLTHAPLLASLCWALSFSLRACAGRALGHRRGARGEHRAQDRACARACGQRVRWEVWRLRRRQRHPPTALCSPHLSPHPPANPPPPPNRRRVDYNYLITSKKIGDVVRSLEGFRRSLTPRLPRRDISPPNVFSPRLKQRRNRGG